ncbi:MAG: filamentous hemagglutinin N-terminal domain-containing protein [Gammaproteobacteria bacterium]|uniref:two-partner secretion domain-containing protein n=1 Tax=Hydrogenophaga sp. TaxID=1904254 RepID=UPI0025C1DE5F|nr:filamentous hemagglutinin N-terminal domain-containing protein [Hydrogenophaga sp.]MBU4180824.1 filamentous hemagglutinin N-terminal domain-containing protein [Gammaproteobacteria bacterium]MBU4281818.1 filamentous hemagglutinin N-terminal domain-containing protein [Gammaproteobacteria bacterium]MBU4325657.1 filamentous hemagglutinin N-terminal domain-containing protein [Gammaproteobacteria bacterium]MCG2658601.1 filamentous hemagglutinin N-terminal domain-containing protein [Hydrogenophaga 
MNHIHRSIWNRSTGTFVAVSEHARNSGKAASAGSPGGVAFRIKAVSLLVMLACGSVAMAQPTGGVVTSGNATIAGPSNQLTITQTTPNAAINWQGFGIAAGESVRFVQPDSRSIALNRVVGNDPSAIHGNLSANGTVFLINPHGILFGRGSNVNVGGLVASTLNLSDDDFRAGRYHFSGGGNGTVINQGVIRAADGGYVALLGAGVTNQGEVVAQKGTVALAAGRSLTLDMAGDRLLSVSVDEGTVNALVENGGLLQADGGRVIMTTQAASSLMSNAVNNTGVIQARTLENRNGTILLLGGMQNGTMQVGGTLDASAPNGGDGGFIETSAASVKISGANVTTAAARGKTGTWLIDPLDFTIGSDPGDNMSGIDLSLALGDNDVIITNAPGVGNGDIFVEDAVTWGTTNTLSLRASRDVIISGDITTTNGSLDVSFGRDVIVDAAISATNGNVSICCGRDIEVTARAAITTINGSILLAAGRDATVDGALSATDGNIMICAARDLTIGAAITVTDGSTIPAQSLGLPRGLVLSAGYGATSPGEGGTLTFETTAPTTAVTNAPAAIYFNPVSYVPPFDYEPQFSLTEGAVLTQYMLVFPEVASKTFDGTTSATLTGLKGLPPGVELVAGSGANAQFSSAAAGLDKTVTFSGYTLDVADPDTANYAFAVPSCCGPVELRTSGDITAVDTPLPPPRPPRPRPPAPAPAPLPSVSQPVVPASEGADRVVGNWNLPVIPVAQETPYRLTVAPLAPTGPVLLALESPAPVPQVPVAQAPIVVPVEVAPPVLVAPPAPRRVVPVRPPKQDRN